MANRSDGRKFLSSGRPPDKSWIKSCQRLPSWGEKGPRRTRDSGMRSMENRYGLVPPQPERRKRHADDGTLGGRYTNIKRNVDNVQWDDSQKRILFESKSVNKQNSQVDQTDELLRKLLEALTPVKPITPPARVPESITLDKLSKLLMSHIVRSEPELPNTVESTGLEAVLRSYFTEQQSTGPGPRGRPMREDWSNMKCFSCGKSGHSATRCPSLDVSFPFILPGWKAEKKSTGFLMISPKRARDRRQAENED